MVARITRILLIVQLLAAVAIGFALQHRVVGGEAMPSWRALACGLLAVVCIRALIAANNFRLAARFAGATPSEPIGWRRGLVLYLRELAATLISSSWDMPFRRLGAMDLYPGETLPVLLIHGYGCNSGYWRALHRRLCSSRISHHAIDLEPLLADIDSYVPQVEAAITALCAATGHARVIIVAHSMGGLVARAWSRVHGQARLACLITLGTPHHGTGLAHFSPGENSRQMQCGTPGGIRRSQQESSQACSAWLTDLDAAQRNSKLPLVSIYSHHDNIIAPSGSSFVDGAINIGFAGIGHVALASHPDILRCVIEQIRRVASEESSSARACTLADAGVAVAASAGANEGAAGYGTEP